MYVSLVCSVFFLSWVTNPSFGYGKRKLFLDLASSTHEMLTHVNNKYHRSCGFLWYHHSHMLHENPFETEWAWGPVFGVLPYQEEPQSGNFDGTSSFSLVNATKIADFSIAMLVYRGIYILIVSTHVAMWSWVFFFNDFFQIKRARSKRRWFWGEDFRSEALGLVRPFNTFEKNRWRVGVTWLVFRRMGLLWWIVPWWKLISDFCKRDTCDVFFSIYNPPSKKKGGPAICGLGDVVTRWKGGIFWVGGGGVPWQNRHFPKRWPSYLYVTGILSGERYAKWGRWICWRDSHDEKKGYGFWILPSTVAVRFREGTQLKFNSLPLKRYRNSKGKQSSNHPSFFSGQLLNFPGSDRRISEPSTVAPENFGAFLRRIWSSNHPFSGAKIWVSERVSRGL